MQTITDDVKLMGTYIYVYVPMSELMDTNKIEIVNHAGIVESYDEHTVFEATEGTQIIIRNGIGEVEIMLEYKNGVWMK